MTKDAPYMTVPLFAAIHCVHIRTVRRWIEEEKIDAVRSPGGRFWRVRSKQSVQICGHEGTRAGMKE